MTSSSGTTASGLSVEWAWFFSLIWANSSKLVPPYLWPYSIPIWANTPGMVVGADPPVEGGDRTVATLRGPGVRVSGPAAASEQSGAGQLLDPDGEAAVDLTGLDRHDRHPKGGGAGRTGVGDVVDGDAGLADLLLQGLAARAAHEVAEPQDADVLHGDAAVGQGTHGGLGRQIDGVLVGVLPELGHVDPEDPNVLCSLLASSVESQPTGS